MRYLATHSAARSRDARLDSMFAERRSAKPRLERGFVSPGPLTCHRGGPLVRRACTKPAFVHFRSLDL